MKTTRGLRVIDSVAILVARDHGMHLLGAHGDGALAGQGIAHG